MDIRLNNLTKALNLMNCITATERILDFPVVDIYYCEDFRKPPNRGILYLTKKSLAEKNFNLWNLWLEDCIAIKAGAFFIPEDADKKEIESRLYKEMAQYYEKKYKKIVEVNLGFLDIALKCRNLQAMIDYFGRITSNPVIIYDEFFNEILITDKTIKEYNRDEKSMERHYMTNLFYYKQKVYFTLKEAPKKECIRLLFPVLINDMAKGYLAIFDINQSYDEMDFIVLESFSNMALMEMMRLLDLKNIEKKYISDFLYDLIFRKTDKIEEIKRRAHLLKVEERADYCIIAIESFGKKTDMRIDTNGYITRYEFMNDRIMNSIANLVHSKYQRDIVTKFDKTILLVHKLHQKQVENYDSIKKLANWLMIELSRMFEGMIFQLGIGTKVDSIEGISQTYRHALSSLNYGQLLYSKDKCFSIAYNDSSLLKIFSTLKDIDSLQEIIPESLIQLNQYDQRYKSNLFQTLRCYLECNCNAKKASEKMYIHYKTMLYRLDKIQNEFGIAIDNIASRVEIELGIQMLDIMNFQSEK